MTRAPKLLAVGLAAAFVGGAALADTAKRPDSRGDTKGEAAQSAFDFRSARVRHAGSGHGAADTMIHAVVAWKAATYKSVVLEFKTGEDPVFAYVRKRPGKKAGIYNYYTHERIGSAQHERLSDRSFSFTFNTEFMGHPDRYGWRWRTLAEDGKTFDRVPNKGWVWHDLSHD